MIVYKWWEKPDWKRSELLEFFGFGPLRRGLINSLEANEEIPDRVYDEFPEFNDLKKV